jgi:hypothetical protein
MIEDPDTYVFTACDLQAVNSLRPSGRENMWQARSACHISNSILYLSASIRSYRA